MHVITMTIDIQTIAHDGETRMTYDLGIKIVGFNVIGIM